MGQQQHQIQNISNINDNYCTTTGCFVLHWLLAPSIDENLIGADHKGIYFAYVSNEAAIWFIFLLLLLTAST